MTRTQEITFEPRTLSECLREFLLEQRSRQHSPNTLDFYERHVTHFIAFCPPDLTITALTPGHIRAFFVHLQEDRIGVGGGNLKPMTVNAYARAIRAFVRWSCEEEEIPSAFRKVKMPKTPDLWKVSIYSPEQVSALFSAADKSKGVYLVARNRAILAVLLDTGLRAGELLSLTLSKVDGRHIFEVSGKGSKSRRVIIGTFAQRELHIYLRYRRTIKVASDALWLNQKNEPLAYHGLQQLFKVWKAGAGITQYGGLHVCRHTAATNMYRNGMKGPILQELLGHESFDTTRRYYLDISPGDLEEEHSQFGMMDNLTDKPRRLLPIGKQSIPLPSPEVLLKEVKILGFKGAGRKYSLSDNGIRKHLKKAGLL